VECEEVTEKAWFLGPRALGKIQNLYRALETAFEPQAIALQRYKTICKREP
jgi:hypothetical protein